MSGIRRMGLLALLIAIATGIVAGTAGAGGPPPSISAVAGRVWVTSNAGVTEIDAFTGTTLRHPTTPYPYPTGIGASDGWIWITSVTNGYTASALTRVPFNENDPGRGSLTYPRRPIYDLAVGSGITWILLGPWNDLRLVAIDQARNKPIGPRTGHPVRHDLGWIAADNTGTTPGLYGTAGTNLVRLRNDGSTTLLSTLPSQLAGHPLVALGSVWIADRTGVSRVNATTGRLEGSLELPMDGGTLAVGGGSLWLLRLRSVSAREEADLVRINPVSMRTTAHRAVPGAPAAASFSEGALWIVGARSQTLYRVDTATLRMMRVGSPHH